MPHTVSAQIITIIKRSHGAKKAGLNFHFFRAFPTVSRKQTRKPGLLLLFISLKLALFSVTAGCVPRDTDTHVTVVSTFRVT